MGRTQSRVVMGALVLGLLGGSAELARCPEFVSFSQTALPISAAAQGLPVTAGYQAASFHVSNNAGNNASGAAHETLLKASMPVDRGVRQTSQIAPKPRHKTSAPSLLRSKQQRTVAQQVRQFVVLTSWTEQRRVVAGATEERVISTSYAAVPVAGGWLVIQL